MKKVSLVVAAAVACISTVSGCKPVFEAMPHKKWGFINRSGTMVIPAQFDDVARDNYVGRTIYGKPFKNFSDGLCAVRLGNKWGYIDKTGKFVIAPQYVNAGAFSEGLACVQVGTKYGYIDKSGTMRIPAQFDLPQNPAAAQNQNPDWDFSKDQLEPLEFSEGLAVARTGDKCGYIDTSGRYVIPAQSGSATPFRQGLARFNNNQSPFARFIDRQGNPPQLKGKQIISCAEGIYLTIVGVMGTPQMRYEYFDEKGVKIPGSFAAASDFSEGLAVVAPTFDGIDQGRAFGYIDRTGQLVIKPQFDVSGNNLAGSFHDGLAVVSRTDTDFSGNNHTLHGIIDRTGKWVLQPRYDSIAAFNDGLARTFNDNKLLYLDKTGREALRTKYTWGNSFSEGLAAVMDQ